MRSVLHLLLPASSEHVKSHKVMVHQSYVLCRWELFPISTEIHFSIKKHIKLTKKKKHFILIMTLLRGRAQINV